MNTFKRIANLWDSVPVVTAHSVDTFKAALDYVAIKHNNCQSVLYNKITGLASIAQHVYYYYFK